MKLTQRRSWQLWLPHCLLPSDKQILQRLEVWRAKPEIFRVYVFEGHPRQGVNKGSGHGVPWDITFNGVIHDGTRDRRFYHRDFVELEAARFRKHTEE